MTTVKTSLFSFRIFKVENENKNISFIELTTENSTQQFHNSSINKYLLKRKMVYCQFYMSMCVCETELNYFFGGSTTLSKQGMVCISSSAVEYAQVE